MNKENVYYVYVHRRESDNLIFYVGKGKKRRAFSLHDRNKHWHNTKNKHGFIVEIIAKSLTETEAFQKEIETISECKRLGYPLCNMTAGGEGSSGYKQSAEQIAKRVAKNTGQKRTMSQIESARKSFIGHRLTLETKEKLRLANAASIVFSNIAKTLKTYNVKPTRLPSNITGILNSSLDLTIYTFKRTEDNLIFTGNRSQLREAFKLKQKDFDKLFYVKGRVTSQGWKIVKE